jgi:Fe-S cluster assembly ATP-binding protein
MLKIIKFSTRIAEKSINENVNLEINPGEVHLIVGPNGAGKSTLAKGLLKYPGIDVTGEILLDNVDVSKYTTEQIAKEGLFLSHQAPVEIPGVKYLDFLRLSYNATRPEEQRVDLWTFVDIFNDAVKRVGLPKNFIDRELNAGFSGGEKKKSEILQMLILQPKYAILDEIDSGLDVDSTKRIYDLIKESTEKDNTGFLIITHNVKIFDYITPTKIHMLKDGTIAKSGGKEIIDEITEEGFNNNTQ